MKIKTHVCRIFIVLGSLFLITSMAGQPAVASDDMEGLVKTGDIIPAFSVPAPKSKAHRKYLGLGKEDQFKPAELEAQMIIIEVLNLY